MGDDFEQRFRTVAGLVDAELDEQAEPMLRELLREAPQDGRLHYVVAVLQRRRGRPDLAEQAARTAAATPELRALALVFLAELLTHQGPARRADAERAAHEAVAADPASWRARLIVADALVRRRRFGRARDELDAARSLVGDDRDDLARALMTSANIRVRMPGGGRAARRLADEALAFAPDDARLWAERSRIETIEPLGLRSGVSAIRSLRLDPSSAVASRLVDVAVCAVLNVACTAVFIGFLVVTAVAYGAGEAWADRPELRDRVASALLVGLLLAVGAAGAVVLRHPSQLGGAWPRIRRSRLCWSAAAVFAASAAWIGLIGVGLAQFAVAAVPVAIAMAVLVLAVGVADRAARRAIVERGRGG